MHNFKLQKHEFKPIIILKFCKHCGYKKTCNSTMNLSKVTSNKKILSSIKLLQITLVPYTYIYIYIFIYSYMQHAYDHST